MQTWKTCPNCLGRGKVMGFATGERQAGDPGGWKAVVCPVCEGSGQVSEEHLRNLKQEGERLSSDQEMPADEVTEAQ